jgi:NAD-dependent SIR2 family protein deacetylase
MNQFEPVINLIRNEDVVLFVGSGCSIASGAPFATKLANDLFNKLPKDIQTETEQDNLQKVSEALCLQEKGRDALNEVLNVDFSNLKPSKFHKNLVKIPHIHTIITTNYDSLIEDSYYDGMCQVMRKDEDCGLFDSHKVQVYKIHGDLQALDRIVISEKDYRKFIDKPKDSLIWSQIQSAVATKHIVFVGYSVEDVNVLNLIEGIIQKLGNKNKKLFLISPSIKRTQAQRLQALDITHIIGTGEEFLDETIKVLKDTFGIDKENNTCSQDTLGRFGLLNNVIFSLENDGKHTSIKGMRPKTGDLLHQLNFTTHNKDFFATSGPLASTEIIKGFEVPYRSLTPEEISTFEHRVNGIRVNGKHDYTKVLIGPAIKEGNVIFQSEKGHFRLAHKIKSWSADGSAHLCIDSELCRIEYILSISDTSNYGYLGKVNTALKESFKNLDEAIKWANLLVNLIDQDDFIISLGKIKLPMIPVSNHEISQIYHDVKEYLENLRDIEIAGGFMFDSYERYSPDLLQASRMVRSFLSKKAFIGKPRNGLQHLCIDVDKDKFVNKPGQYAIRIVTNINGPVLLNSKEFYIDEERAFMMKCEIRSVTYNKPGIATIDIYNLEDKVQYEYTSSKEPDLVIQGTN